MIKLLLSYDGTPYWGWQKTNAGPTIQETLQRAIFHIAQEQVVPEAASRTDRGVHAEGQVVSFSLKKEWNLKSLQKGLNAVLPPSIRIPAIESAEPRFHATLDAKEKEYHYRLCLCAVQDPIHRLYSWHFRYPLNLSQMKEAAESLVGERDFSSFANEKAKNPICTLSQIAFSFLSEERLQISLKGNRFLYKMARNLVGTLIAIGSGRSSSCKGPTAPAHALFLHRVDY